MMSHVHAFSCISVGTKKGYSIINCDPYGKMYSKSESCFVCPFASVKDRSSHPILMSLSLIRHVTDEGATAIVEMLFCTSLVALVSAGDKPSSSPRRLQIVNTKVSIGRSLEPLISHALTFNITILLSFSANRPSVNCCSLLPSLPSE